MKKFIYIFLALFLFSCEKEIDKENEQQQQTGQEQSKLMDIQFEGEVFSSSVSVKVNGNEISSMSANVYAGDIIEVKAYNSCTSNGCPSITSIIYIDGVTATEEQCYCEVLNYNYTVE